MNIKSPLQFDELSIAALADCVDAIGREEFPRLLSDLCAQLCCATSIYLSAYFVDEKLSPIYTHPESDEINKVMKLYNDVGYILDPLFQRFRDVKSDEVISLREFAPDDFKNSEYYLLFYGAMGLNDECAMQIRIGEDAALIFSFGVHGAEEQICPERLTATLPLIISLARRHWTVLTPTQIEGTGRLAAHLEMAFTTFGSTVLSPREGEIVRLILQGHSSKSIARYFGSSPETIKVHRRSVYNKLDITSQGELLSLFLTALSLMPPFSDKDPLEYVKEHSPSALGLIAS